MYSKDLYSLNFDSEFQSNNPNIKTKLKFLFESVGSGNVVKAIEYASFDTTFQGMPVYNFGFGDYNATTKTVSDITVSNNGDVYKVFNTVLSTVPRFFEEIPKGLIFVQGSDSDQQFIDSCKKYLQKEMPGLV